MNDSTGRQFDGLPAGCDRQPAVQDLQQDRHCRGVFAEFLVGVEREEHEPRALGLENRPRHGGGLIDLDHCGHIVKVGHLLVVH